MTPTRPNCSGSESIDWGPQTGPEDLGGYNDTEVQIMWQDAQPGSHLKAALQEVLLLRGKLRRRGILTR